MEKVEHYVLGEVIKPNKYKKDNTYYPSKITIFISDSKEYIIST